MVLVNICLIAEEEEEEIRGYAKFMGSFEIENNASEGLSTIGFEIKLIYFKINK